MLHRFLGAFFVSPGILFLRFPKQFTESGEVLFDNQAHSLRIERIAGEVAVVVLIVEPYGQVAIGSEEIADVEIADKRGIVGRGIVAIAKLTVDEQAVIEQSAVEQPLIFGIAETLVARRNVGSEAPIVALHHIASPATVVPATGLIRFVN